MFAVPVKQFVIGVECTCSESKASHELQLMMRALRGEK
jgi:hypothetical protein